MTAWRIGLLPCVLVGLWQAPLPARGAEPTTAPIMVAPPRTISDITAVLDRYRPDAAKSATEKSAADAQPTADLSGVTLARFYYQRGIAAGQLGRMTQQLEDLRHAVALGAGTDTLILGALSQAEFQSGNPTNAIRIGEQRIPLDAQGVGIQGRLFGEYAALVRFNVARGNLDEAARWVATIRTLYDDSSGWHPRAREAVLQYLRQNWRSNVADAETQLALAKGLNREAEASARTGVEYLEQFIRNYQTVNASVEEPPLSQFENRRDDMIVSVAVALREQGRLVDAELEARRALTNTLKNVGRYHGWTAVRLNALTGIILEQGRAAEAERLAHAAIDILETVDATGSWTLAHARQSLGGALAAQGRWADALASYDAMLAGLAGDEAGTRRFGAGNLDWVAALIKVGRPQPAVEMTTRILQNDQRIFGDTHYKTAEARAYLAMALAAQGNRELALQNFRGALPTLLDAAPQSAEEAATAKAQRLRLILDAYIRLLAEIRATPLEAQAQLDAAAEAFRLADTARGQAVQRALAAASARVTVQDPALADLARREQDAGKQIAALEGVLVNALSAPSDQQDAGAGAALRDQVARLRQARDALLKDIERRFPDYAELINPKPATIARARQALRPGEALFASYVSDDATFVWAVPQQGTVAFAKATLSAAQLDDAVKRLRGALDPQAQSLSEIPPFDVALAGRLYDALLKPVEPGWHGATSLLAVTDRALAQLPLGVLVTATTAQPAEAAGQPMFAGYKSVPFLARRVAITQLPSVAALPTLRALPAAAATRKPFVGFGDPQFGATPASAAQIAEAGALTTRGVKLRMRSVPKTEAANSANLAMLPPLPDTADEVRSIARALDADPDKDVFVGIAANEHTVKTLNLSDRRVIAFATHGLVPGDLNGLTEPALALSAPTQGEGDGLLTMDEVLALKLNADWVVLSACNTASGDGAGAEAVSGLGRAFFYAGARALLVSNWPVETISARLLTTDLFRRQAESPQLSRAEALRQAELALIDGDGARDAATNKAAFSYAHPIFWAPFSLVGDGGGAS